MTIHRTLTATLPNITDFHCWDHNPFPVVAPVTWQVPSGVPTHTIRFPHQLHPSFPKAEPQMSHSMKTETAQAGFSEERSQRNPWAFISSQSNHAKVSSSQVPLPSVSHCPSSWLVTPICYQGLLSWAPIPRAQLASQSAG